MNPSIVTQSGESKNEVSLVVYAVVTVLRLLFCLKDDSALLKSIIDSLAKTFLVGDFFQKLEDQMKFSLK